MVNWEAIGAIGEVFGAAAVVATFGTSPYRFGKTAGRSKTAPRSQCCLRQTLSAGCFFRPIDCKSSHTRPISIR